MTWIQAERCAAPDLVVRCSRDDGVTVFLERASPYKKPGDFLAVPREAGGLLVVHGRPGGSLPYRGKPGGSSPYGDKGVPVRRRRACPGRWDGVPRA
ncbi:hypothetical protein GCM10023196_094810 [Actinoallomurus vinaceus]|uniref:FAD-binding FR-type domain-containing protein n=1 Tax=Actinoallomurus vinaceus TaxID=1080074 RepID=A0ABP8URK1_9ACTN